MTVNVAIIYYSAMGTIHTLAQAVAEGAESAGGTVRLRRVRELAPPEAIAANPAWSAHQEVARTVQEAELDDLRWADAVIFGTPTRFGNVAAQLKQFLDTTGPLWFAGELSGKVASGFTSARNQHGGNESTLLALYNTMYHWGAIVVPPGYTSPEVTAGGGNPYGTAHVSGTGKPTDAVLAAARYQGRYVTTVTAQLKAGLSVAAARG